MQSISPFWDRLFFYSNLSEQRTLLLTCKKINFIGMTPNNIRNRLLMKLELFFEKRDQTPKLCLEAVKQNGDALRYVRDQTPKLCLEAVKENGHALRYVRDQTLELCLEAVKQNGDALRYVRDQTPELCLEAVKRNGDALRYVRLNKIKTMNDRISF